MQRKIARQITAPVMLMLVVGAAGIVLSSCQSSKDEKTSEQPTKHAARTTPDPRPRETSSDGGTAREAAQVTLPSNPGPAARLVESFFRDWEAEQYDGMYRKIDGGPSIADFTKGMRQTPVRWKRMTIQQVVSGDNGWYVTLTVEVTDLASIMACFLFNHSPKYGFDKEVTRDTPLPAKPVALQIETFMKIEQVWHLVSANDTLKIQIAQQGKNDKCKDTLVNYILDAGTRTYVSPGTSADMFRLHMARIIVELSGSLGMSKQETGEMTGQIGKKTELAMQHFETIMSNVGKALDSAHEK